MKDNYIKITLLLSTLIIVLTVPATGCYIHEKITQRSKTTSTTDNVITSSTTVSIPTKCPPDNSGIVVHLPHETNCSRFYKCDNGKKVLQECPDNLYFNPIYQVCDYPSNVDCINSTTMKSSTHRTTIVPNYNEYKKDKKNYLKNKLREKAVKNKATEKTTTEKITTTTEGWKNPKTCVGKCPIEDPSDSSVYLSNIDCTKFCQCSNGQPQVNSCPNGLHFNAAENVCDFPEFANCTPSILPPSIMRRYEYGITTVPASSGFLCRMIRFMPFFCK